MAHAGKHIGRIATRSTQGTDHQAPSGLCSAKGRKRTSATQGIEHMIADRGTILGARKPRTARPARQGLFGGRTVKDLIQQFGRSLYTCRRGHGRGSLSKISLSRSGSSGFRG